jgi:pyridoxamine 5'-phosphate oxidase
LPTSRREYASRALDENDAHADPMQQFSTGSTRRCSRSCRRERDDAGDRVGEGEPSARTVLLKGADEHGFVFYTNYDSAKGRDLAANPRASLLFFWAELERQVRINGSVTRHGRNPISIFIRADRKPDRAAISNQAADCRRSSSRQRTPNWRAKYKDSIVPRPAAGAAIASGPSDRILAGPQEPLHDRLL